ncbi:MAG TPA: leucyl aminopeptidase [Solirubrobacteraceae bacterium]|nr:leucyl aminopeptidase [Solirubrobacteraceae bacterium]
MDKVAVIVRVSATTEDLEITLADTVAVGLFDSERPAAGEAVERAAIAGSVEQPAEVQELIATSEARGAFTALALAREEGRRWLLVGLGREADFTPERARVAAAAVHERTLEIGTKVLRWEAPGAGDLAVCTALVEGTVLANYRFERHKSVAAERGDAPPRHLEELIIGAPDADAAELEQTVSEAEVVANAVNAARDLQNRPANDLTPTALVAHAQALAEQIEGLSVESEGREGLLARGMGAFAAVAQGSEQEPALITLRYDGAGGASSPRGPVLGLVGKAVTFDSGGISLKPGDHMDEMKYDMSGGAAVIEAIGAIARLRLPVKLVGVVGATENLPSGRAVKPGDIVTSAAGKTIEVNNTDAEGRLVLADCLHHAVTLGAQRIVDLATLTGAVIVALGSTYAGLIASDDELAERVTAAGARSGEIVWRLPLHAEYDKLIEGRYGDLNNAPEERKAGTIVGAAFLSNFVGETPWAHLDIAGSAWDLGRAYAPKSASGYGVRLLVELARSYC